MKNITIAGRLTKDGELKTTQNGDKILQFSVAVDDYKDGQKQGMFFDVAVFGKRALSLHPHMSKGGSVCVAGEFNTHEHNGKTYLKIAASNVDLTGSPQKRDEPQQQRRQPENAPGGPAYSRDMDDDIPFAPSWK